MKIIRYCLALLAGMATLACSAPLPAQPFAGRKVLFIDSYNDDYVWSRDITRAVRTVIEPSGATLKIVRMDTKNNPDEAFKLAKGKEIKALIDSYRPDVVVAADDNASKYVIAPYFRDTALPVVFCGINWDASRYGFPARNVTGMVEVSSIRELVAILKAAGGNERRVGILAPDNENEHNDVNGAQAVEGIALSHVRYVRDLAEWKAAYVELQDKVDMLVLQNHAGIIGWDDAEVSAFVGRHAKTLTAAFNSWMTPFAAISLAKNGSEQGRWAAETALRILAGARPSDIRVARNGEDTLIINAQLARMSRIAIPQAYFDAAAKVIP